MKGLNFILFLAIFSLTSAYGAKKSVNWVRLETGFGMPMTASTTGFNFRLGSTVRITKRTPLYLGLDTGFDLLSVDNQTYTMMPLQMLAMYRWESGKGELTPYLGVAMGPYIGLDGAGTEFAFFLKPGVDVMFNKTLGMIFETKMGARDGNFYLAPQVNLLIAL